MRRTAGLVAGVVLGVLVLAPAATAAPCTVALTCDDAEPEAPPPAPAPAPTTTSTTVRELSPAEAAAQLLARLNGERSSAGLAPFTMRADVTEIAAQWTSAMASSNHLAHNDAYFTGETRTRLGARLLGENVAYDGSIDAAHAALMASPPHRANILDARFTVIGIAAEQRDGTWWVTEDFVQPVAVAAPAPTSVAAAPAPTPSPAPAPAPAPAAPMVADATPTGAVLSATSAEPEPARLAAAPHVVTTSRPPARTGHVAPPFAAIAAAALLLVAYALSCVSASARIRCRWSPRRTSRG